MKITRVELQKKNPRRFNVFLDGKFAFGADEDLMVARRLIVGKELTASDIEEILNEAEIGKVIEKMYSLFSIRQRTEKEVRDYFRKKNFESKIKDKDEVSDLVVDQIILKLIQKGLLNDAQFARSWVEARRRSKQKGIQAIRSELVQKGIDQAIIEEVLSNSDDPEGESKLAYAALEKKAKIWRTLEPLEFKKKAIEFLVRRGFVYSTAKETVDRFLVDS